jgi:exonuclease V gamma subunit
LWDWRADERGGATVDAYRVLRRLASPVKAFLEEGLQARGVGSGDELPRTEMFFPDRLEEHNLREAILNQLRHGDVWSLGRLAASGGLPPGLAGRFVRQSEERGLASRLEAVSLVLGQSPVFRSVTLECPLADRTLRWEGELARGDGLQVVLDAGRMKGKRWLSLGLAHAAACVHEPWTTVYVALDQTPRLSLWSPSVAADQLHAWVALADQTLSRALPLDLDAAWFWCRNPELPRAERLAETWALAKKNAAYDGTFLTALGESESWAEAGLEDDFVALAEAVFGSWAAMVQGVRS